MEVQIFLAAIFMLFVFTAYRAFLGNKVRSIFTAVCLAICLSTALLISLVIVVKKFRAIEMFFNSWGVGNDIYFYCVPLFLVLLVVLLTHRTKFNYGLGKTLVALTVASLVMWGLFVPVALLTSCAMGDCL